MTKDLLHPNWQEANEGDLFVKDIDISLSLAYNSYDKIFLPILCLFKNPLDYPDKYVARIFLNDKPTNLVYIASSYDELSDKIPKRLHRIPRDPFDDPAIIESWV